MKLLSMIACGTLLSFPGAATATDLAPLDVPSKADGRYQPGNANFGRGSTQSHLEQAVEDG